MAKFGEEVLAALLKKPSGGLAMLPVMVPCTWKEPGKQSALAKTLGGAPSAVRTKPTVGRRTA